MPNPPPALPPVTSGPIHQVPCCHCGKPNNFHGHHEMLETGNVFQCDHCRRPMQICAIQMVKFVSVRSPRGQVQAIKRK